MNEMHYDEETLLTYIENPAAVDCGDDLATHMLECEPCNRMFASVQEFLSALGDASVWGEDEPTLLEAEPDEEKLEEFLAFARTLSSEQEDADVLVPALLRQSSAEWRTTMEKSPRLRTAAALRRLADEAKRMLDTSPSGSLELSILAVEFAERLPVDEYTRDSVFQLRGICWKEKANALRYLGRRKEGLKALDRAETAFSQRSVCHFDLATVAYARGALLFEMERTGEALPLVKASAETFLTFGDLRRYAHARLVEGSIHFEKRDYGEARDVWMSLLKPVRADNDLHTLARLFNNLGHCFVKLGEHDTAGTYFLQAMLVFQDLGMEIGKIRSRWGLGRILVATGKFDEAIVRLRQSREDFESHSMHMDGALVALDMVEAMLANDQMDEVPELCRGLIERFSAEGMSSTAGMAMAYLREAVAAEEVTPRLVGYVRAYLEELPGQPSRPFAPPPS